MTAPAAQLVRQNMEMAGIPHDHLSDAQMMDWYWQSMCAQSLNLHGVGSPVYRRCVAERDKWKANMDKEQP